MRLKPFLAATAFFAALATLPLMLQGYALTVAILTLHYAYLGQAWNIMTGFCGQLSLGHALFTGLGGYGAGIMIALLGLDARLAVLGAIAIGAVTGALVSLIAFRFALRGIYFALLTLALSEFCLVLFSNWLYVGGSAGLFLPALPANNDPFVTLRGGPHFYYYLLLALTILATLGTALVTQSRVGFAWRAIGADEEAARALGVRAYRLKVLAAAISGGMAGLGGAMHLLFAGNLFPDTSFSLTVSIAILLGPVIGGIGTLFGPILGSMVVVPLNEAAGAFAQASGLTGFSPVVQGIVLMIIVLVLPAGLWPSLFAPLKRTKPAR